MRQDARFAVPVLLIVIAAVFAGCQQQRVKPDYNRPLPPGANALRKLRSPADWPDLRGPFADRDAQLAAALDRSLTWFTAPSASRFFPLGDVTFPRARASVYAFQQILADSPTPRAFERALHEQFDCYTTVGYDNRGTVLYTGYFTPVFEASRTRTPRFQYPLYRKPADLHIDPITGEVYGRKLPGGGHAPYPTRTTLETSGELDGLELVYLPSRLDQYIIQVNGSAKLRMRDGGVMYVGYAGTNGREYTGLGATLLKEGVMEPERLSLSAIRRHFQGRPHDLERYIRMNDRFVFFTEYDGDEWPSGSLGVQVTPKRTLATDKEVFPRGGVVLVETRSATSALGSRQRQSPFRQLMLDQDTGGAIRAAGRGDIYMGIGPDAEHLAAHQFAKGRLYYFFLKPERVDEWMRRMQEDTPPDQNGVAVNHQVRR